MKIRLLAQKGQFKKGTVHDVVSVVPHGGYTDDSHQYVLADGTHVHASIAEEVA